jgi:hypothetical protein
MRAKCFLLLERHIITDPYIFFLVQIAAFIAEPVMGAGGVILPPETYFDKVISHRQYFRLEFTIFSVFKNFFMKFSMISI